MDAINTFFDALQLITKRLPVVQKLILKLASGGLTIYGAVKLLQHHQ